MKPYGLKRFPSPAGLASRTARSTGQSLTNLATGAPYCFRVCCGERAFALKENVFPALRVKRGGGASLTIKLK